MQSLSSLCRTWSPEEPPAAARIVDLFATARRLRAASHAGAGGHALRGKNLALLLSGPSGREVSLLHRAAQDLGARVAEVPFETDASVQADLRTLGRLLGRMYDAIDCDTLPPSTVRTIEREAGVPVYSGLGLDDHPARVIADLLTLCERGVPPAQQPAMLFIGDPQTPRGSTFLAAARALGFAVRLADSAHAASNDAAYVVDATRPPAWSLHARGCLIEEARRSENHRCVIQTVLLDTIPRA